MIRTSFKNVSTDLTEKVKSSDTALNRNGCLIRKIKTEIGDQVESIRVFKYATIALQSVP